MFAGFEHLETIDTREFGAAVHSASINLERHYILLSTVFIQKHDAEF
jgi:hypothetical protein